MLPPYPNGYRIWYFNICYAVAEFLCVGSIYLHVHQSQKTSRFAFLFEIIIGSAIISSKYSGLIWLFCLICLKATTQNRTKILKYGCLVGCGGSFLHTYLIHNNPVFPKFASIFGAGFFGEWRSWAYDITLQDYGYGRDFIDYCLLPFRMFSSFDLQYGFQGSLGISIGIFLFFACITIATSAIFSFHGFTVGNTSPTNTIFIPAVVVIVIYGIVKIPRNKLWILVSLSIIWSMYPIQQLWKRQQGFDYWTQYVDDRDFLRTQLPENYPIDEYINTLETRQKIWYVWMRGYTYYSQKKSESTRFLEVGGLRNFLKHSEKPLDVIRSLITITSLILLLIIVFFSLTEMQIYKRDVQRNFK